jgi:hypothetical protein
MATDPLVREAARVALYRLAPDRWVLRELGIAPDPWQVQLLRTPPGAQVACLTARQAGKTQGAAWAVGHAAVFQPRSLSVFAAPSMRQSAEAIRRVKAVLLTAGEDLVADNVFGLETKQGSRVVALPGDESTSRGLSVDGIVVADEAARLAPDMIAALRPMRARHPQARFMMLSTAWSRTDEFWKVWEGDDPSWIRIESLASTNPRYTPSFLASELAALGETAFRREYLGEPIGHGASPFDWALFDRATVKHEPRVQPGPAFMQTLPEVVTVPNPFQSMSAPRSAHPGVQGAPGGSP